MITSETALTKAIGHTNGIINTARSTSEMLKAAGRLPAEVIPTSTGNSFFWQYQNQGEFRFRYSQFRGWLYAAIHAIAETAATQPAHMGRATKAKPNPTRLTPAGEKAWRDYYYSTMTKSVSAKAIREEFEIIVNHELLDAIERPNPINHRYQFVYNFTANLLLTGWSYVVGGENENGDLEFYAVPTTWVHPQHDKGPFSEFQIYNPEQPVPEDNEPFTRKQVAFAHLPNPSDPMSAMAPAQAVMPAIRIDDHIQTSQEQLYNNGIFPSVVVTVGKEPHPDVPGGTRPRLTAPQRRQVIGAIRKTMAGVANYGNPAIIDGMIENITKMSTAANEMGWTQSEKTIKARILSAYGVHPWILGEQMMGSYAQAAMIEERFCKKVNIYLDMLGSVMTNFAGPMTEKKSRTLVWWEQCKPNDPSLDWTNFRDARKSGDVTRNELRAKLGLPPDDSGGDRSHTFSPGDIHAVVQLAPQVSAGAVTPEQASMLYRLAFDLTDEEGDKLAGVGTIEPPADSPAGPMPTPLNDKPPEPKPPEGTGGNLVIDNPPVDETLSKLLEIMQAPIRVDVKGLVSDVASSVVASAESVTKLKGELDC